MPGYREITIPGEGRRPPRDLAPTRSRIPAGGWRAVLGDALRGVGALCRQSPGTVLGSFVALGAAGLICVNALGHQSGRHPAPILPKVAAAATASRLTPGKPAADAGIASARDVIAPEAKGPVPGSRPKPAEKDPIGALIRAEETTASVTPSADPKAIKPDTPVAQAQRALSRLGYGPIRADGLMGPGTRAAIEKFERAAQLPVTGEAAGRTLRALVSKAKQG